MSWYTVYRTSDGALKGHGQVIPDPLPPQLTSIDHGSERQDQGNQWNPTTLQWEPLPVPRLISYGEYLDRFTLTERRDMYLSTHADMTSFFRAIEYEGLIGKTADLDGLFIGGITNLAVSAGIISAQRKAEILA